MGELFPNDARKEGCYNGVGLGGILNEFAVANLHKDVVHKKGQNDQDKDRGDNDGKELGSRRGILVLKSLGRVYVLCE